jgi:hypothetical protein
MALAYKSGTAGAVRTGSNVAVAGLKSWTINKQLTRIPVPSFDLTADANSVVWNSYALNGLAEGTADVTGWYNTGDTTESILYIGAAVSLDLLFDKTTPYGYLDQAAVVVEISAGTDIEANKAAVFSAKFRFTGAVGIPS